MADTTVNQTNVVDLPEYVKPYYKALLNGVTGLVFDPNYTAQQLGNPPIIPTGTSTGNSGGGGSTDNGGSPPADSPVVAQTKTQVAPTAATVQPTAPAAMTQAAPSTDTRGMSNRYGDQISQIVQELRNNSRLFGERATGMASGGMTPDPMMQSLIGGNAYNTGIGGIVTYGTPSATVPITYGDPSNKVVFMSPSGPTTSGTPYTPPTTPNFQVQPQDLRTMTGLGLTPGSLTPQVGGGTPSGGGQQQQPSGGGGLPGLGGMQQQPTGNSGGAGGFSLPVQSALTNSNNPSTSLGFSPSHYYDDNQYANDDTTKKMAALLGGEVAHTVSEGSPFDTPSQNEVMINGQGTSAGLDQKIIDIYGEDLGKKMIAAMVDPNAATAKHARGGIVGIKGYADGGQTYSSDQLANNTYATPAATPGSTSTPQTQTNGYGTGIFQPYQPYQGQRLLSSDPNADPNTTWKVSDRTAAAETGLSSLPNTLDSNGQLTGPLGDAASMIHGGFEQTGNGMYNLYDISHGYQDRLHSQYGAPQYTPSTFSSGAVDPSKLQLGSAGTVQTSPLTMFQQQGPQQWTDQNVANNYMDPYMQSVVDTQKASANRDFAESKATRDAQAERAGAFGGSRQAVADSMANRDLQTQLANIQATGSQNAYQNAQNQFNNDRSANMGASANNLNAALQTQGLGAQTQLAAAQGNQNTAANQYGQLFSGQLQTQLANQSAGLQAQQLAEQSKQYGAGLENQGQQFKDTQQLAAAQSAAQLQQSALGMGIQAAGQQSQIGANYADLYRLGNQMQTANLQQEQAAGSAEDARRQAGLNLGYQDYLNAQNYPYQQANFYSGILRGVPTSFNQDQVQVSQNNYNPWAQVIGTGIGAAGTILSNQNKAKGGIVSISKAKKDKPDDPWAYRGPKQKNKGIAAIGSR